MKLNLLNLLNKNPPEAGSGRGSYTTGFMSSEFLKIFKNSRHSDQNSSVVRKASRFLNKNSNLNIFSRILQNSQNSSEFLC